MFDRFGKWLKALLPGRNPVPPKAAPRKSYNQGLRRPPPKPKKPELTPEFEDEGHTLHDDLESLGPGKNVLVRKRYVREETGTHEKLKILDESLVDSDEETGLDPYNTGSFDRSKKWDQRFRK